MKTCKLQFVGAVCVALMPAFAVSSQTTTAQMTDLQTQIDLLKKQYEALETQNKVLTAEKTIVTSQKELADAKVKALGLPEFENKTTLNGTDAGKLEAMLLGSQAIRHAAAMIRSRIEMKTRGACSMRSTREGSDLADELDRLATASDDAAAADALEAAADAPVSITATDTSSARGTAPATTSSTVPAQPAQNSLSDETVQTADCPIVLLAGSELPPWQDALTVQALVDFRTKALEARIKDFESPEITSRNPSLFFLGGGVSLVTSAITAASKLFAQETTVSAIAFSASDALLMRALAAELGNARRPEALLFVTADDPLIKDFAQLQNQIIAAERVEKKGKSGSKLTDAETNRWNALQAELTGAKALATTLTTARADGTLPLFIAARYAKLLGDNALVATIYSDFAGGSAVNTKNILSFFGADPMRISGGLVASYTLTDPRTGQIVSSGIVPCRTAFTRLRRVQDDTWGRAARPNLCLEPTSSQVAVTSR